ncbi:MAG: hypothetical protein SF187_10780 [Deltaproteobacteria bacterium]|nr:hypothetical protein [Deltaproteobacteria bacterium]
MAWSVVSFSVLGSIYVLTSVAVTIFRRRNPPASAATPVSETFTADEVRTCLEELSDVRFALEKHLGSFHNLLAGYTPSEAQRWGDEGALWRKRWSRLGQQCRFGEAPAGNQYRKQRDEMASLHDELGAIHLTYTRELKRFGNEQVPRLQGVHNRLEALTEAARTLR